MWHQEKCDLCGDCLIRCQYVDYDKEKAIQQIKELMEGKSAEILEQCVTCCACNEYCPTGANPFDLINRLQEVHSSLTIPEKMRKFIDAGGTVPSAGIQGDGTKPALWLCAMEWALPDDAVGGRMFEGMTVVNGGEYFPDPPSRHHLPAKTGFRKLKRRCLRSLLLAAYCPIRLSRRSSAPCI